MTKEEKAALLVDLCGRLPYGVKGKVETTDGNGKAIEDEGVLNSVFIDEYSTAYICIEGAEYELDDFKPYLRPMSDMTGEEYERFGGKVLNRSMVRIKCHNLEEHWIQSPSVEEWLNRNHFDYRELISRGLALEAPKDMYN